MSDGAYEYVGLAALCLMFLLFAVLLKRATDEYERQEWRRRREEQEKMRQWKARDMIAHGSEPSRKRRR